MKYLFYDTECSNCYGDHGKIIEFGYCLTDDNFNIIKKDVFQMSPGKGHENRFDQSIYKRDPSFQYAWDEESYFQCEELPFFYEKIKELLEDKDTLVFGFAIDNDIRNVASSVAHYQLKEIVYKCYDVQILMNDIFPLDKKGLFSLKESFLKMCSVNELIHLQEHLSRDDAVMTMRVVEELCKHENVDLSTLLSKYSNCEYDTVQYMKDVKRNKEKRREKQKLKAIRKLNTEVWRNICKHYSSEEVHNSNEKLVTITAAIKSNKDAFKTICDMAESKKFFAYNVITGSDYLVCLDDNDIEHMHKVMTREYNGKIITLNEFQNLFQI